MIRFYPPPRGCVNTCSKVLLYSTQPGGQDAYARACSAGVAAGAGSEMGLLLRSALSSSNSASFSLRSFSPVSLSLKAAL